MKIRVTVATIVRLFKVDAVADLGGGAGGQNPLEFNRGV